MKRKLLIASALVIVIASLSIGTLAYFTGNTIAHNVITSGNIDITLLDSIDGGTKVVDEDGKTTGWSLSGVMPGQTVKKNVSVQNTGFGTAWIRVKVDLTITGADGKPLPLAMKKDGKTIPLVSFDLDSESWQEKGGYVYYLESVDKDGETADLFEDNKVTFAPEMSNEYQGCHVAIQIQAQAVQTANNPIPQGGDVTDVLGWPAE